MRIEHRLPSDLIRRGPVRILIVGAGGTGSSIAMNLPYLDQAMRVWGHTSGLDVTMMDADTVSATNCVRQPFSASDIGQNCGGVSGVVVTGFPLDLAGSFIERNQGRAASAGHDDDAVAIDQGRFAVAPVRNAASELFHRVELPQDLAAGGIEADDGAFAGHGVELTVIEGRGAAGAAAAVILEIAAGGGFPELVAGFDVQRDHEFLVPPLALGVHPAIDDGERGVADAEAADFPENLGSAGGPGGEKAGFGGDSVAIRASPLGPIGGVSGEGEN